jgi:hypothetical protein
MSAMLVPLGSEFGMSVPAMGQLATLAFLPYNIVPLEIVNHEKTPSGYATEG